MDNVVDFVAFKKKKEETGIINGIEFVRCKPQESFCTFCQAPTTVEHTSKGTAIHTYTGVDMEEFRKIKDMLTGLIKLLRSQGEDADKLLIEAFGQGMEDFMKEMDNGS